MGRVENYQVMWKLGRGDIHNRWRWGPWGGKKVKKGQHSKKGNKRVWWGGDGRVSPNWLTWGGGRKKNGFHRSGETCLKKGGELQPRRSHRRWGVGKKKGQRRTSKKPVDSGEQMMDTVLKTEKRGGGKAKNERPRKEGRYH